MSTSQSLKEMYHALVHYKIGYAYNSTDGFQIYHFFYPTLQELATLESQAQDITQVEPI